MPIALFDLDDTLIYGNCETAWFEYLAEKDFIDAGQYRSKLDHYDQQYARGVGNIDDYMHFVLNTLTTQTLPILISWREEWLRHNIEPIIAPGAHGLLQNHRDAGDTLVIITASNSFCVEAIAQLFKVDHFICTQALIDNDRYTGQFKCPTCFAAGKLTHLKRWLKQSRNSLADSFFYSDSHNDLPLLELVKYPVAVDANPKLQAIAIQRGWQQMSLRKPKLRNH